MNQSPINNPHNEDVQDNGDFVLEENMKDQSPTTKPLADENEVLTKGLDNESKPLTKPLTNNSEYLGKPLTNEDGNIIEDQGTYLSKVNTLKYTGRSSSWLYEYHRKTLLKYSLYWESPSEKIKSTCKEIRKVVINKGNFEWFNNIRYLPKKVRPSESPSPSPLKNKEKKQVPHQAPHFEKQAPQEAPRNEKQAPYFEEVSTRKGTQIVDSNYLTMLKEEYEVKKKLEKDYSNKDNQINVILQNLTEAMKVLKDRVRQLEGPKEEPPKQKPYSYNESGKDEEESHGN